jgi:O-6-methylguanine DNA methyltransferase
MDQTITIGTISTPLGILGAALTPRGLGRLTFPTEPLAECERWGRRWLPDACEVPADGRLDQLARELQAYFAGELRVWTFPLDLRGTPFQLQVWEALQDIPYGQVRAYSQLAATIGRPQAIRAVGAANGANPIPIIVPCHRLIGKNGSLIKYGGGLEVKRRLLELEGAPISTPVAL